MKTRLQIYILFVLLALPSLTFAAGLDYKPLEQIPGFDTPSDFFAYVGTLYKFGIWAAGISAMFMIMIGGYMYMVSGGNNSLMGKAKDVITDAIIGLILALTAYLILYTINPTLVSISSTMQSVANGGAASTAPSTPSKTLAKGCDNYASAFDSASGGDKNFKCFLIAIANAESGCDPSRTSPVGACGIMQLMPKTAGMTCDALINDPNTSIQKAASYIKSNVGTIPTGSGFDIGKSFALNKTYISYGNYKYDKGNDDLIAAYNAGSGKIAKTPGMKGPFDVSSDCPNPKTPAWQCNINPGGFVETQNYVQRVQSFEAACLAK